MIKWLHLYAGNGKDKDSGWTGIMHSLDYSDLKFLHVRSHKGPYQT